MRTGKRGLMRSRLWLCGERVHCEPSRERIKAEGYWVRGVDIKTPEFLMSAADDFEILDLRELTTVSRQLRLQRAPPDEVYQLAADMGWNGIYSYG